MVKPSSRQQQQHQLLLLPPACNDTCCHMQQQQLLLHATATAAACDNSPALDKTVECERPCLRQQTPRVGCSSPKLLPFELQKQLLQRCYMICMRASRGPPKKAPKFTHPIPKPTQRTAPMELCAEVPQKPAAHAADKRRQIALQRN
ncbi:hypothetical protein ACSSS7_002742 [Eimeria intestinalis]